MARLYRCGECHEWRPGSGPTGDWLPRDRGTCVHKLIDVKRWKEGRKRPEAPFHVTRAKTPCKWGRMKGGS